MNRHLALRLGFAYGAAAAFCLSGAALAFGTGLPVSAARPRLLLSPGQKSFLMAKVSSADPTWLALKQQADRFATYSIFPYKYSRRTEEPNNTIFYDYQGEGWFFATMPLGLAYQMTGNAAYSAKLIELADEMIRAQGDPENNPPAGLPPLRPDNYYPTRYLGPVLAYIYDWCYEALGSTRRAQMVTLMNAYFDDLRANAYQRNDFADGNYFPSHLFCAAAMGYASFGDNPRAQEMIDYARIRFDGSASPLVAPENVPTDTIAQVFEGGYRAAITRDGGPNVTGAPARGGVLLQGWAYGTGSVSRLIDYMLMVKSATGEDLFAVRGSWFSQILRAQKHALLPNRFEIDPIGDWGGDYGPVIIHAVPVRLAHVLAGTPDGPAAQHFATSGIVPSSPFSDFPDAIYQSVYKPAPWEGFFFSDPTRPSAELTLPPYSSGFSPAYPRGAPGNGALPEFVMRSDWGPSAVWASLSMGAAWYDDHQHKNAGHITLARGEDYLLVDAASWMGPLGGRGIVGGSTEENNAAAANTLFLNDFGDFQRSSELQYLGGQGNWGKDEIVADEQNLSYSYVRSDLSTAYNRGGDPADQAGRRLESFYRSFVYLRSANVFVVYDQVRVKSSTNPRGPYVKHLRWHFPNRPTVTGKTVRVTQGASRLQLDTLLPASAAIAAVDESNNPDRLIIPCDNPCNSGTWRIEVADPSNALTVPFLTVIAAGPTSVPTATTSNLTSLDSAMTGVEIAQPGALTSVVYFNNRPGQTPDPILSTSFRLSSDPGASYVLCGFLPNALYSWVVAANTATVSQNPTGDLTASAAGVLQYPAASAPCMPGANTLCLNNSRFRVQVSWRVPSQGTSGAGMAVPITGDTGYFWFFSSNNIELVIKVVDGRAFNGYFWVFYGALSNVEYTITVTDTATGVIKTYFNQSGTLSSVADTGAFSGATATAASRDGPANADPPGGQAELRRNLSRGPVTGSQAVAEKPEVAAAPCVADATTLCLNNGRFRVQVAWQTATQQGLGVAVSITGDTGYFWFFSSNNIELVIKVVDGRAFNNKFWVFYGALSDVQYAIMVTDTVTGTSKTYVNPRGTLASVADTAAF